MSDAPAANPGVPSAVLRRERRISWAWIVPILALALAGWLTFAAWQQRGLTIIVHLEEGHGLRPGDAVRFRGINVGVVDDVALSPDLRNAIVTARLTSQADRLARNGSRFWVVRPQLALTRIEGLDTIVGPRFLAVLPPDDPRTRPQRRFTGMPNAPLVETSLPGDLEIILEAPQRGSLAPGSPVYYRQSRIGTILSVGLAGDGGSIEARAHIQQPFVQLIRPQTRFWDVGGLKARVGFMGLSIDVQSAEALLVGGVALATPPPPNLGEVVRTGHRFVLDAEPSDEWLKWRPVVAIGSSLLPPGVLPPQPLRASIGWKQGRIFSTEKSRHGWLLLTQEGLLGPADLLKPGERAQDQTAVLEVAGEVVTLDRAPMWERAGLALLEAHVPSRAATAWPSERVRAMTEAEECIVIADSISGALPIAAARMSASVDEGGAEVRWHLDSALPLDESWHGASVVARRDGYLVGMLLATDDGLVIAPVSE